MGIGNATVGGSVFWDSHIPRSARGGGGARTNALSRKKRDERRSRPDESRIDGRRAVSTRGGTRTLTSLTDTGF